MAIENGHYWLERMGAMNAVSVTYLKNNCLELVREVEKHHDEIGITRRGRPVARIVPAKGPASEEWRTLRNTVAFSEKDMFADEDELWGEVL